LEHQSVTACSTERSSRDVSALSKREEGKFCARTGSLSGPSYVMSGPAAAFATQRDVGVGGRRYLSGVTLD
jgi:hypothetical protein